MREARQLVGIPIEGIENADAAALKGGDIQLKTLRANLDGLEQVLNPRKF